MTCRNARAAAIGYILMLTVINAVPITVDGVQPLNLKNENDWVF